MKTVRELLIISVSTILIAAVVVIGIIFFVKPWIASVGGN